MVSSTAENDTDNDASKFVTHIPQTVEDQPLSSDSTDEQPLQHDENNTNSTNHQEEQQEEDEEEEEESVDLKKLVEADLVTIKDALDDMTPISISSPYSSASPSNSVLVPKSQLNSLPRFGLFGVWFALIFAHLLWAIFHTVSIPIFRSISPFVLPSLRALICIPCFFIYGYYQSHTFWVITPKQLFWLALCGFFGNFLNQQLLNIGLSLTSAADAGLVQPAIPVFTTILALLRKQEEVTKGKALGIFVSTLGSLVIVISEQYNSSNPDVNSTAGSRTLGLFSILGQTFAWSIFLVIQTPLLASGVPIHTCMLWMFLCGGVMHVLFGLYFDIAVVQWQQIPSLVWVAVLYVGIGATFIAFLMFAYAAKYLPASICGMATLCLVIFSPVLGMIFLGEQLSWGHLVGGLLIGAGLIIVIYTKNYSQQKIHKSASIGETDTEKEQLQKLGLEEIESTRNLSNDEDVEKEDEIEIAIDPERMNGKDIHISDS